MQQKVSKTTDFLCVFDESVLNRLNIANEGDALQMSLQLITMTLLSIK